MIAELYQNRLITRPLAKYLMHIDVYLEQLNDKKLSELVFTDPTVQFAR